MDFNANQILFRSSQAHLIMTKEMGATAQGACLDAYAYSRYGIEKEINSKYFEKGNKREELGITYLTLKEKGFFQKNEERISNDFITGLPDLYAGKSLREAERIIDIKNAWSYNTFLEAKKGKLSNDRFWQGQSYMALTGAKTCDFAICCINAPMEMIYDERRRLQYKLGIIDEESPEYIEGCKKIERRMIFDMEEFGKEYPHADLYSDRKTFVNIPMEERIIIKTVERSDFDIGRIYQRVEECRKWINENLL